MASSAIQDDVLTSVFIPVELIHHLRADKETFQVLRNVCRSWLIAHDSNPEDLRLSVIGFHDVLHLDPGKLVISRFAAR
jgi:hypothetical protein